jgi:hypothetical protein
VPSEQPSAPSLPSLTSWPHADIGLTKPTPTTSASETMRRARHLERTADAVRGTASVVFKPSISVNKPVILLHLKSDTLSKTEMFFQAMSLLPLPFRPRLHYGALGPPNRESLKIQDLTLDRRGSGSTVSRSKMVGASQTALASRGSQFTILVIPNH